MFKEYKSKKIISYKNLNNFIKKNKKKRTVLCHGVFDIVHPGHIRHFAHCKQTNSFPHQRPIYKKRYL